MSGKDVDMARLQGCALDVLGDQLMPHQNVTVHREKGMTVMNATPTLSSGQEVRMAVEIPENLKTSELLVRAGGTAPNGQGISGVAYFQKGGTLAGTPGTYSEGASAPAVGEALKATARKTAAAIAQCAKP